MSVWINDESFRYEGEFTLENWLLLYGPKDTLFAVTLNDVFVARQSYSNVVIKDGDRLNYIVPMQGG